MKIIRLRWFIEVNKYLNDADFVVKIIERQMEESKINLKNAPVIISGGYGVGSKENFDLLFELAHAIGAGGGASKSGY